MKSLTNMFNEILNLLKYPLALLFLLLLYELFHVLYGYLEYMYMNQTLYSDLFMGMFLYMVSWLIIFRNIHGNWFLVIEHELTHTLFALFTFHRIVDLRVTDIGGGYVSYVGTGNWLILIAPYFFNIFFCTRALFYFSDVIGIYFCLSFT